MKMSEQEFQVASSYSVPPCPTSKADERCCSLGILGVMRGLAKNTARLEKLFRNTTH